MNISLSESQKKFVKYLQNIQVINILKNYMKEAAIDVKIAFSLTLR